MSDAPEITYEMVETQQYPLENRPPLRFGRTVCPVGEKGLAAQVAGRPAAIARFVSGIPACAVAAGFGKPGAGVCKIRTGPFYASRPDSARLCGGIGQIAGQSTAFRCGFVAPSD